jgi:hypothetical protein
MGSAFYEVSTLDDHGLWGHVLQRAVFFLTIWRFFLSACMHDEVALGFSSFSVMI